MTNLGPYFSLIMNNRVSASVDTFINDLLDTQPKVVKIDDYCTTLEVEGKRIRLWTANKWFAYATRAGDDSINGYDKYWNDKRPRRKTMVRLNRYIEEQHPSVPKPDLTLNNVLKGDF